MSIEEQLKQEILCKYKSIRAFTTDIQIPYSTLDSVFKRGLSKAGIDTMLKVFSALDLDIESIPEGVLRHRNEREKKSPESVHPTDPEEIKEDITNKLTLLLNQLGLIAPDGEVSQEDEEFLMHIMSITKAYFKNRGKSL